MKKGRKTAARVARPAQPGDGAGDAPLPPPAPTPTVHAGADAGAPPLPPAPTPMYECFACGASYARSEYMSKHWNGDGGYRKCDRLDALFNKDTLTTKEWALLEDKTAKPIPIKEWQDLFGEGPYRIYIYVDEKSGRVTRVGQTKQAIERRLEAHDNPPLPSERVYEAASGLSQVGATNLEAFLLQCHNLRAPACRMRNDKFGWPVDVPADKSSAQMRAMAVGVLKPTMLSIKSGRAVPIDKPQSARRKARTPHKVTSTEAIVEGMPRRSNSQLERIFRSAEAERARRANEPSSATSKRRRDGGADGEGTPAAKRR